MDKIELTREEAMLVMRLLQFIFEQGSRTERA